MRGNLSYIKPQKDFSGLYKTKNFAQTDKVYIIV